MILHIFPKGDKGYIAFVFQSRLIEKNKESNELDYDFFDIRFLKNNRNLLRNDKLILSVLDCLNKGSQDAIAITK